MPIQLTRQQIDDALPKVVAGLNKYLWLQDKFARDCRAHNSRKFRRKFNHYYMVRRNQAWQQIYYAEMARARKQKLTSFSRVLSTLKRRTGRVEASFASKLVATIVPSAAVIDKYVLLNASLSLPANTSPFRIDKTKNIYRELNLEVSRFLRRPVGKYMVHKFRFRYPRAQVTNEKILDLVLWKTRA